MLNKIINHCKGKLIRIRERELLNGLQENYENNTELSIKLLSITNRTYVKTVNSLFF